MYVCEGHGSDVTKTVRARIHKPTLVSVCDDMLAERYLYTTFCELCYSTKRQFAFQVLLEQSTNSGVYDIRKTNRDDS